MGQRVRYTDESGRKAEAEFIDFFDPEGRIVKVLLDDGSTKLLSVSNIEIID